MEVEGTVTFIGGCCKGRVKIVIKKKGDEEDDYPIVEGLVTFIGGNCKGRVKIVIKHKDEEDDYLVWKSIIPDDLKVCYTKESNFNIFFFSFFKNISVQNSYSVK